jgi:hypothetical protein
MAVSKEVSAPGSDKKGAFEAGPDLQEPVSPVRKAAAYSAAGSRAQMK